MEPTREQVVEEINPILITSGKPFFSALEMLIKGARKWLHLQFYIFQSDETGSRIAQLLEEAAARGVQVFLLIDAIGSPGPSNPMFKHMQSKGVQVRHFEPLNFFKEGYLSRRLHHKIAVSDQMDILLGGINIANRYNDMDHEPAWLDIAVALNHAIYSDIKNYCEEIWEDKWVHETNDSSEPYGHVRFLRNDWRKHLNEISIAHLELFRSTKKEIIILCSYFLPGKALRRAIKSASLRNVSIKLISTATSDVPISKHAERWLYDWLFRNKVRIFEFQKNVLHAKMILSDSSCINIGSYNINNLSAYGSLECNLEIRDALFGKNVNQFLKQLIMNNCLEVSRPISGRKYKNPYQFACWICFQLLQGLLYITTNGYHRKATNPKIRRR
jgi:cardiolipin synthase